MNNNINIFNNNNNNTIYIAPIKSRDTEALGGVRLGLSVEYLGQVVHNYVQYNLVLVEEYSTERLDLTPQSTCCTAQQQYYNSSATSDDSLCD